MNALVELIRGELVTSSRLVAEMFEKRHGDVLRKIDDLIEQKPDLHGRNFAFMFDKYEAGQGAERDIRSCTIDRDGFSLLAMGFTGKKALEWKCRFIDAFNAMERVVLAPPEHMWMLDTPEAIERTRVALFMVREARVIFGRGGAADLWVKLGFPEPERRAVPRGWEPNRRYLFAPLTDVAEWKKQRLRGAADDERVQTSVLYHDYVQWCSGVGLSPTNHSSFGKSLSALGVDVTYSDGAWRLGVKLAA